MLKDKNIIVTGATRGIGKEIALTLAQNGAGKTTLLKILCEEESYDSGDIFKSKESTIGYLSQHNTIDPQLTVYDALLNVFQPLIKKEERLRVLEQLMTTTQDLDSIMKEYDQLSYEFERDGGYTYQSQIKGVIDC